MEYENLNLIYKNHFLTYSESLDLDFIGKEEYIKLPDISEFLTISTVSVEDKKFWVHKGLDWERFFKATYINIKAGQKLQGASTISQQYIKNLFLMPEKTLSRKLKEMYLAALLEQIFTKEEILEFYLNIINYGNEVYGVGNASEFYFEKPASDLLLEEATFLTGIPNSPNINNPLINFEYAKYRQLMVIHSLVRNGLINKKQAYELMNKKVEIHNNKKIIRNIDLLLALQSLFFDRIYENNKDSAFIKEIESLCTKRTLELYKK